MLIADWINLGNAVCTFLAVMVAIGLGANTHVQSRREAMTRAKLFAARITARLSDTTRALEREVRTLGFVDVSLARDTALVQALADVRRFLAAPMFQPDDATLLALAPLHNHCAHRIARAFDYIERVRRQGNAIPGMLIENTTSEQRERLLVDWSADLHTACDLLVVALNECIKATAIGAPVPAWEERDGAV